MSLPCLRYRCVCRVAALLALTAPLPSAAQGDWAQFRRCRPAPLCPPEACPPQACPPVVAEPPIAPTTDEPGKEEPRQQEPNTVDPQPLASPPSEPLLSEPLLSAVTSAALGGAQASINMFGDAFGKPGIAIISLPKTFTNYRVFDLPAGRLGFAPPGSPNNNQYLQSTTGQPSSTSLLVNDTITLDKSQPLSSQGAKQISNGVATITQSSLSSEGSLPTLASGIYAEHIVVSVPNPGSGGVVGRARLSEDLNPLPRDRVIFNYDYFNQTQLTADGLDVHRYVVGLEKTFFDRMASVEVRLPFASTLNSDIVVGTQATHTELGDLRILLKGLLYTSPTISIATGLGIYLPTAQDVNVSLGSTRLVHIDNRAVILTPYVGALFTPTDRLFAQVWTAFDFDTNGCPVEVANSSLTGLQPAGRLQDQTLMQWDVQVGYWLLEPNQGDGIVQGLAPFAELHYGTTLQNADSVQANSFLVGNLGNRTDELNIAAGFAAQVFDNLLIMVGAAAPLRQDFDRGFDYQIGVRASLFFGPTAAARRSSTFVSGF